MSIEFRVVKTSSLPEKFQPPGNDRAAPGSLPAPVVDLTAKATSELTEKERRAFLARISGRLDPPLDDPRPRGEWQDLLVEWLKEEANRFMAAAVALQRLDAEG